MGPEGDLLTPEWLQQYELSIQSDRPDVGGEESKRADALQLLLSLRDMCGETAKLPILADDGGHSSATRQTPSTRLLRAISY
jgi:hypothetical protein